MNPPSNLFGDLPRDLSTEQFATILAAPAVRIQRIVSHGHASPPGFWYDQAEHEWEDGETTEMRAGDYVNIPAHRRHRVEWTHPDEPTVWIAIHYA
jgi:cupin 2 domain-containing protein